MNMVKRAHIQQITYMHCEWWIRNTRAILQSYVVFECKLNEVLVDDHDTESTSHTHSRQTHMCARARVLTSQQTIILLWAVEREKEWTSEREQKRRNTYKAEVGNHGQLALMYACTPFENIWILWYFIDKMHAFCVHC